MAITFDATSVSTSQTSSPITVNHTTSGTDRLLLVSVHLRSTGGSNPSCSAVTYNGVSMTSVNSQVQAGTGNRIQTSVWMLHAPATGSNQISATCANFTNGEIMTTSYTGAQQSSTADNSQVLSTTGTGAKSVSVTTVADNCWVYTAFTTGDDTTNPTLTSATQTERQNQANGTGGVGAISDTNGPKTPAGAVSSGWTVNGTGGTSTRTAGVTASFAPVVVGGDASVSKSESITITESNQLKIDHFTNKSESVTLSETTNTMVVYNISVSDSVTVSDSASQLLEHKVQTSDSITVTESVELFTTTLYISVSDSVSISENKQFLVDPIFINVSDSVSVSESTGLVVDPIFVSTSDSISASESVGAAVEDTSRSVNVSENVGVSESVTGFIPTLNITVSESISVSESYTVEKPAIPSIDVGVALNTHTVSVELKSTPNVSVALPTSNIGASLDDYAVNIELFNPALTVTLNSYTISVEMKTYSILVDLES